MLLKKLKKKNFVEKKISPGSALLKARHGGTCGHPCRCPGICPRSVTPLTGTCCWTAGTSTTSQVMKGTAERAHIYGGAY